MFEFDEKKSVLNLEKHGIDFNQAQNIWDDERFIEVPSKNIDEKRFLIIGKINKTCWTAIITYRRKNVRIISVRRSRKEEVNFYENF